MRKRVERMGRRWGMACLLSQYCWEDDLLYSDHNRVDLLFYLRTKSKE